MTSDQTRLLDLLERLEATLGEMRELIERSQRQAAAEPTKAIEAFADEALRDRDA